MQKRRRSFVKAVAASSLLAALPPLTFAQDAALFDSIHMFVPAAAGGGWDGTARAIETAARSAGLVRTFQVENVGGAGGLVGLPRFVNQRKGQGNALMIGGSVMIGAALANKSPITLRDVTPIVRLTEEAGVIVVPTSGKIQSWQDLAAALKANPKAVSVAGGSAGGTDHQLLGLVINAIGGDPRDAAYVAFAGGGPANAAIIGGQVVAGISGYSEFQAQITAGRMKALAVSGANRIPGVDVPTLLELGVNVTAANWRGLFGAPGITAEQRAKLEALISRVHTSAGWREALAKRNWTDAFLAGDGFAKEIAKSMKETEGVLTDLGLA